MTLGAMMRDITAAVGGRESDLNSKEEEDLRKKRTEDGFVFVWDCRVVMGGMMPRY